MQKFLSFDEMVTPTFIVIIYWLGIVGIVIAGIAIFVSIGGFSGFLAGIVYWVVGLVFWRVFCEMMLIVFRIHDDLGTIARNTAPGASPMPTQPRP